MEKCRGVYRDADLGVEITWFRGLSLSFPAHFHDCYVIGVTARGVRPAEAALRAGFSDQSHFTRQFVRHLGVSPGEYRAIFSKEDSV